MRAVFRKEALLHAFWPIDIRGEDKALNLHSRASSMLRLEVYDGQVRIHEIELSDEVVSMGRDPGNTLMLPDSSVSRRHAQIERNGDFFLVRDCASTNGTFVNESLVRVQVLYPGDSLRVGKYVLRVEAPLSRPRQSTKIRVEELRLPGKRPKTRAGNQEGAVRFEEDASNLRAARERFLRLCQIQKELASPENTEVLLDRALDAIFLGLECDRASLFLCSMSPRGGEAASTFLPAVERRSKEASEDKTQNELPIPEKLLIEAASSLRGVKTRLPQGSDPGSPVRSCLASPLRERGKLYGLVYLDREPSREAFGDEDLRFLDAIAAVVASSLSNAELLAQVSLERDKAQAILSSLEDGVLGTDKDFKVMEANAAAAVLLGMEGENLLGSFLFDLFSRFQLSPEKSVLYKAAGGEEAVFRLTSTKGSEGTEARERLLSGKITPYPRDQVAKGLIITLGDQSGSQTSEDLKPQLIAEVVQKLRSSIALIQGHLPILRSEIGKPAPPPYLLEEVERSSQELCRLLDQLIELTDVEMKSPRALVGARPVKLKTLLEEAVGPMELEVSSRGTLVARTLAKENERVGEKEAPP